MISIEYIPPVKDLRPIISYGKKQCLSEAEEVPKASGVATPGADRPGPGYQN